MGARGRVSSPVLAIATVLVTATTAGTGCLKRHVRPSNDDLYAPSKNTPGNNTVTTRPVVKTEPERPPAPPPAPVARWATLTHDLAAELGTGGGTCSGVAKTMRAFVTKNGKELGSLQSELIRWERGVDAKSLERFYRGVFPDLSARIDAGIRCKDDASARAAFDQFFQVAGLDTR